MRKTIAVAFLAVALAGCTAPDPRVDEQTVSQMPPPAPDQPPVYEVPSPTQSVLPDAEEASTQNCYIAEAAEGNWQNKKECIQTIVGSCLAPTSEVREHTPGSVVAMVGLGIGNTPGERWWVVAWKNPMGGGDASPSEDGFVIYLTNEPSVYQPSGVQWISVGQGWGNVAWTEDRLAFGQAAARRAISCL